MKLMITLNFRTAAHVETFAVGHMLHSLSLQRFRNNNLKHKWIKECVRYMIQSILANWYCSNGPWSFFCIIKFK